MITKLNKNYIYPLIIILAVLGVYFNALDNGFVWDDDSLILENSLVRSWDNFLEFFRRDLHRVGDNKANFYRPLQAITFCLDYSIGKLDPAKYHFTNIFLHFSVALNIYLFILLISKNPLISFWSALLFAVHPLHTQAVTYISGRADPLAALFIFLSLNLYIYSQKKEKNLFFFFSLCCFILSLLSKEIALVLPFLIILCDLILWPDKFKKNIKYYLSYGGIWAIYIILRLTLLKFQTTAPPEFTLSFVYRILTATKALSQYTILLFAPVHLHMERVFYPVTSFWNHWGILTIVFSILYCALLKPLFKSHKIILFGSLWFLLTIFPLLNLLRPLNAFFAEHWLYIPSVGFFLVLSLTIHKIFIEPKKIMLTIIGWLLISGSIIFFSTLTIIRNPVWKSNISLYQDVLKYNKNSARVYNNLGNAYAKTGEQKKAFSCYKKALQIAPNFVETHNNLGILYKNQGNYDQALAEYTIVKNLDPNYITVYHNLGVLYNIMGRYSLAIQSYQEGIKKNPRNSFAYSNLSHVYINTGLYRLSIEACEEAIRLDPSNGVAYNNMGVAYLRLKSYDKALACFEQALKINPASPQTKRNIKIIKTQLQLKQQKH